MIDEKALFKLSYGLFFIGSKLEEKENVCVVNTVIQVTQEPLKISVTMLKTNLTTQMIFNSKLFTVGVMGENTELDDISHFGQKSGRDCDKMRGCNYRLDSRGVPIYNKNCISEISAQVTDVVDLGTHYMFIADLYESKALSDDAPMTYAMYRAKMAGAKKSAAAEKAAEVWQCSVCHYVYDGEIPFEDLPDDYVCPVCKQPKSAFRKI